MQDKRLGDRVQGRPMLAAALARIASDRVGPAERAGDQDLGEGLIAAVEEEHSGRSIVTRPDQLIYSELDPMTEVYLLTRGQVRLFAGEGSHARTSLLLAAPALFGDRDILAGCAASQESARSISKAHLLCYDRSELEVAFASDEAVRRLLTQDLLRRYARTIRFSGYLALPLEERILQLLYETGAGELPNYDSLALMTDSAVKSVGRAIRALQDSGKLTLGAARGFEISAAALAELAETELMSLFHRMAR